MGLPLREFPYLVSGFHLGDFCFFALGDRLIQDASFLEVVFFCTGGPQSICFVSAVDEAARLSALFTLSVSIISITSGSMFATKTFPIQLTDRITYLGSYS